MKTEKIIGYFLLAVGISAILASTLFAFQVFTGRVKPPQLFSFEMPAISLPVQSPSLDLKNLEKNNLPEGMEIPKDLLSPEGGFKSQTSSSLKILPDEAINKSSNLLIFLLLMGFIASSGAKIALIGVKMIKDIKVVVKEDKIKSSSSSPPLNSA